MPEQPDHASCREVMIDMITTIIFDIGNVLIKFDWKSYVYSMFDAATAERVYNAVHAHGYWAELDMGIRSESDILQSMVDADPELESEIRSAFAQDAGALGRKDYAIPWISELKSQGLRVLFLSNYSQHVMKAGWDVLDFLPYTDGGIFSCTVNLMKPDPAIYQLLVDRYSLVPSECLFVDDLVQNVNGAESIGMNGYVFEGEGSISEINSYLRIANP